MATRPVFLISDHPPFYQESPADFVYCPGFSIQQQRKSIANLQHSFLDTHPEYSVLEISTRSEVPLGVSLSAFNLTLTTDSYGCKPVEVLFQAGKVFEDGLSASDVISMVPKDAKKYIASFFGHRLSHFSFDGQNFPLEPKTFYYDWLYINALVQNRDLSRKLMGYQAFTDIAFNPKKSINCQARSAAIYVSLVHQGLLMQALTSPSDFLNVVYHHFR